MRYSPAVLASLCITGVAFLAYVYLVVKFDQSYRLDGGQFVPDADARDTYVPRYMDWSVTVPLLVVEALAVSGLTGARQRSTRLVTVTADRQHRLLRGALRGVWISSIEYSDGVQPSLEGMPEQALSGSRQQVRGDIPGATSHGQSTL